MIKTRARSILLLVLLFMSAPGTAFGAGFDCNSAPQPVAAQPQRIQGAQSFIYSRADGAELRLHVFHPPRLARSDKRAAVIFFFGGGWSFGSVRQFVPQARRLSQRGMVAIVTDYRVRCRHGAGPIDAMADARAAIRWVRAHAANLGVDPTRLAAGGGSAGGHLAVSAALFDGGAGEDRRISATPSALVLFNPWLGEPTEAVNALLGMDAQGVRSIAPLEHMRGRTPPTLILQGAADSTTPYATALRYCQKAQSFGARCSLVAYEGAEHGFFNAPDFDLALDPGCSENEAGEDLFRATLLEVERFLSGLEYFEPRTAAAKCAIARSS